MKDSRRVQVDFVIGEEICERFFGYNLSDLAFLWLYGCWSQSSVEEFNTSIGTKYLDPSRLKYTRESYEKYQANRYLIANLLK